MAKYVLKVADASDIIELRRILKIIRDPENSDLMRIEAQNDMAELCDRFGQRIYQGTIFISDETLVRDAEYPEEWNE